GGGAGQVRLPHRRVEGAAVQQQVLADDKARRGGAQKGAGGAELLGVADPAGRIGGRALCQHLVERDVLAARLEFDAGTQPVGQKGTRQQVVNRDVVAVDL